MALPANREYIAKLEVRTIRAVRDIHELPLYALLGNAYTTSERFWPLWLVATGPHYWGAKRTQRACLKLYQSFSVKLARRLSPTKGELPNWDPTLQEFYRGLLTSDSYMTSLMALLDYMDLILRLSLYTILSLRGKGALEREIVPDDFAELGESLLRYSQSDDAIGDSIRTGRIPCQLPQVLRSMEEILHIKLTGTEYSFSGLCGILYYVRNKTRGHGAIQEENQSVLWAFAVEASLSLSQLLHMERFIVRTERDRVWAGWDNQQCDLYPMAYASLESPHPILVFDARYQNRLTFIDYFNGKLITPSLGEIYQTPAEG